MAAYRQTYNGPPGMSSNGYSQQPQGYVPYASPPPQLPPVHMSPLQYGYSSHGSPQGGMGGGQPMNMAGSAGMSGSSGSYPSQGSYSKPPPPQSAPAPAPQTKGTLKPGQEVRVGQQTVVVDRYLSEGGYAHVYLTHSRQPIGPNRLTSHCLKRIAFQQEQAPEMMKDVEREIDVMKVLSGAGAGMGMSDAEVHKAGGGRGCEWIVEYLDSSVNRTKNGGWEVFILMEFCAGGGIIDLLNKRLRDRLREEEILGIFVDICEAVAYMHALPRPLLHRDLKIENILSHPKPSSNPTPFPAPATTSTSHLVFKLCDFGSTTFPSTHAPRSKKESDEQAYDLNRHTTLQYRSPEMVEPMLGLAVGLPADVWALGVLLYKLCYYTTPFEEHGPLAIVNAKYTFPSFPVYSPKLQHLIASMLVEHPLRRPSVFEILKRVHRLRGTSSSIDYSDRTNPREMDPSSTSRSSANDNLLDFTSASTRLEQSAAAIQAQVAASVQPQRRGRPTRETTPSEAVLEVPTTEPTRWSKPTTAGVGRPKMQVTGEKLGVERDRLPGSGTGSKLQVTGEIAGSTRPQVVRAGSDISTSMGSLKSTTQGFGDAFGMTSSISRPSADQIASHPVRRSPTKGFDDSFGGAGFGSSFSPPPLLSKTVSTDRVNTVSRSTASQDLEDAFKPAVRGQTSLGRAATLSSSQARQSSRTLPVLRRSPSSNPDGEAAFEERYPSIEMLSSGGSSHPPAHGVIKEDVTVAKSNDRPGIRSYPTLTHASVTGGKEGEAQLSRAVPPAVDGRPLPRSTQVTGTAFKESGVASSQILAVDVRLGESGEEGGSSSSQQYGSGRSGQGGPWRSDSASLDRFTSSSPQPLSEHHKPQARQSLRPSADPEPPKISSPAITDAKRGTTVNDLLTGDELTDTGFSALIPTMAGSGQSSRAAYRSSMPPPKSAKPAALAALRIPGPSISNRPSLPISTMMTDQWSPSEKTRAEFARAGGVTRNELVAKDGVAADRGLSVPPQSHTMAKNITPAIVPTTAETNGSSGLPSSNPERPTASIPARDTSSSSDKALPPVKKATKPPPTARRSSINDILSQFETLSTSPVDQPQPVPALPASRDGGPPQNIRPVVAAKPEQHRSARVDSASIPSPYPSSKAMPNRTDTTPRPSSPEKLGRSPDAPGSPETKQSVNSLIAKWNQANPPVNGVIPQVVKGRQNIGTGRRL